MKKIVAILTALLLISSATFALAEEYDSLSIDELRQVRDEMISNLNIVNTILGQKLREEALAAATKTDGGADIISAEELSLGKIKDLFPDKALAKFVRDETGKISIEQTVTQAELDKIYQLMLFSDRDYGDFADLTGIRYLRNLEIFCLFNSTDYLGTEFPEEFYTLTKLKRIDISSGSKITKLSESLGNLTHLGYLDISSTKIASLPESIGSLAELWHLNISYTNIQELPDSIWNLQLEEVHMEGLAIE